MLYRFLKIWVRLALLIFCRKVIVNKPELLKLKGPLLLACNHPNSFLDAIILDVLFDQPVYSLARGDVFKKPFYIRLLTALKILPVYRTSEGVENLSENYKTFDACLDIFKKKGIVLIFSEGKCINEWHLRPLKKGTARLAIRSWEENIPLQILPIGINYSSFKRFGKNVFIGFGKIISKDNIDITQPDGKKNQAFNNLLQEELEQLVFEIGKADKERQQELLEISPTTTEKVLLFLPAVAGYILHIPLFIPIKKFTLRKASDNDHYDSILVALLLVLYPVYLLVISVAVYILTNNLYSFSLLLFLPFIAWSYTRLKPQLDRI